MKTKEEILKKMEQEMPYYLSIHIEPYILEAMQLYADQAVKARDAEVLEYCNLNISVFAEYPNIRRAFESVKQFITKNEK